MTLGDEAGSEQTLVGTGVPWRPHREQTVRESRAGQELPESFPEVVGSPTAPAGGGAEGWVHPGYIVKVNPPSLTDLQRKKPMDSKGFFAWSGVAISRWGRPEKEGPRGGMGESGPQVAGVR